MMKTWQVLLCWGIFLFPTIVLGYISTSLSQQSLRSTFHHIAKNHRSSSTTSLAASTSSSERGSKIVPPTSTSSSSPDNNVVSEKITYKRFMQVELWRRPELESIYPVLCAIELACRDINRLMRRVSTDSLDGLQGSSNIQGEDQKKLDVISNRIMKQTLCCSGKVSMVASEEEDEPTLCSLVTDSTAFTGEYAAVFDPLDGSSNIDSGLPTGTIFGVHRDPKFGQLDPTSTIKQRGRQLVAAGYCLYSASCHLVITMKSGLHMFTLDDATGEFYLTRSNIRMPRSGNIYSFNDVHDKDWEPGIRSFYSDLKAKRLTGLSKEDNEAKKPTGNQSLLYNHVLSHSLVRLMTHIHSYIS